MDVRESIRSQNDVAVTFSKHVISTEAKGSNLLLSPPSINVILSMIAAGSAGPTKDQILSFLKSQSTDQLKSFSSELLGVVLTDGGPAGGPRLSAANGVWIDKSLSFKPSFKEVVDGVYKAASGEVDFQSKAEEVVGEVNSWAEKQTNGLIKDLLPHASVDSTTRLIFANALYFKGAWNEPFDSSKTQNHEFHVLDGSSVSVPFMTSKKKQYVTAYDGFRVLGLPYNKGEDKRQFSMYIFLPDAKDGLPALLEKLGSDSEFISRHIPQQQVEVGDFRIPKFKITFGFDASKALKDLGLSLPFSGEGSLTEMVDSPVDKKLYVSSIFHKSFIEVNEEGTEAGAASAAVIKLRSVFVGDRVDFVADHPFLFMIKEDITDVVMFIGQVLNPSQTN